MSYTPKQNDTEIPEDIEQVAKFLAEKDGYSWQNLPSEAEKGTVTRLSKEYWRRLASDVIALIDSTDYNT